MKIKVLLLDDHLMILQGIKQLLEHDQDIEVVGTLSNPAVVHEEIICTRPDILITDVRMKSFNGISLTRTIKKAFPELKIVVLSGYAYDEYISAAYKAGANAYIKKENSINDLITTIKQSFVGNHIFPYHTINLSGERLTHKELEVLTLIAEDKTNMEISTELMISKRTVERYISSIIQKMKANSRVGAVVNGIKQGLLNI
ncbi:response regulator transcription factor [Bacillus atrophaeus]|uniref:DNA-binding response regulator, luxR family protein n=2 Tax=Bacillus atrophaeus TaxID=1452 RepID=A0ABN3Z569_BACA1|nr:response regulator transcription factor [Bacillus atrophaeus]AMR63854.1 LuxR family transcriptional regulator [Bacillus subtilis subsp. globigii]ADP31141.1 DNA-binding response regulator, luxR family protein [Bacillus atrophaeus 1942]AIK48560.1 bacterial regulatory s, luxR family protein [Bacillus atrophaeus subsp. globigii]EIM09343.1 DNA-binding response regulator, luxR family protein [Bacillus atrophaeus C89]KFK81307.1 bacterial regulatory s, luxR family protein [Bacillus atrophaeus]